MIRANELKVLKNNVIVSEIEGGMQTIRGIILPDDDMKERGIKPRWCKVFKVGPDVSDIQKDDWILVEHGRWSRGFEANLEGFEATFRWVDHKDILGVQKEKPQNISTL
jgi:co-chaperonin GroES (HSP10)